MGIPAAQHDHASDGADAALEGESASPAHSETAPAETAPSDTASSEAASSRSTHSLQALGITSAAEAAYREVITHGGQEELPADLRRELMDAGLLVVQGDFLVPRSAARLLREHADQAVAAAGAAFEAAREFEFLEQGRSTSIRSTSSPERMVTYFNNVIASAKEQFRAFERPPHLLPTTDQAPPQRGSLERGVPHRVIYEPHTLRNAALLETMRQSMRQGERARIATRLPMRMLIADSDIAFIMRRNDDDIIVATRITDRDLIALLIDLFEQVWQDSIPVPNLEQDPDDLTEPTTQTLELLSLLSMGLTDEVIATELGLSTRTVARRVNRLNLLLEARGRFQLGLQAQRRGWLS